MTSSNTSGGRPLDFLGLPKQQNQLAEASENIVPFVGSAGWVIERSKAGSDLDFAFAGRIPWSVRLDARSVPTRYLDSESLRHLFGADSALFEEAQGFVQGLPLRRCRRIAHIGPASPNSMNLLAYVYQLEIKSEGTDQRFGVFQADHAHKFQDTGLYVRTGLGPHRLAKRSQLLLAAEDTWPCLLEDDAAKDVTEQTDVAPKRRSLVVLIHAGNDAVRS